MRSRLVRQVYCASQRYWRTRVLVLTKDPSISVDMVDSSVVVFDVWHCLKENTLIHHADGWGVVITSKTQEVFEEVLTYTKEIEPDVGSQISHNILVVVGANYRVIFVYEKRGPRERQGGCLPWDWRRVGIVRGLPRGQVEVVDLSSSSINVDGFCWVVVKKDKDDIGVLNTDGRNRFTEIIGDSTSVEVHLKVMYEHIKVLKTKDKKQDRLMVSA